MICATITEKIIENMVDTANFSSADLVELRLDCLEKHTHLEKIGDVSKPVIVTCMPASEGGKFLGSEEDRGGILFETVKYADYVSLELSARKELRDRIIYESRVRDTKVIATYHDYKKTPSVKEIKDILKKRKRWGPT